jgi:tetratricopeptide (TPR) repeat protein
MVGTHTLPPIWNIPYRRNPFFTGHEDTLRCLYQAIQTESAAALIQPQGISGLGGIGKTQAAIEYAYRYHADYKPILWARADSEGTLTSEFVAIAHQLRLPESDELDQRVIIDAVIRWLRTNSHWLLIFDNVEDLAAAEAFIPRSGQGHILLTTRAQALGGIAQSINIEKMEAETGALLLLRRAHVIPLQASLDTATSIDRSLAIETSQLLVGLPLALDQAGAYIRETPCTLPEYLTRYRARSVELLKERGTFNPDYSESVATTWSLSFEKVAQANPAAAELLHLCTCLYPDAIPEEIITAGSPDLGPVLQPAAADPLQLDNALKELRRFSLLYREADDQTVTIHRLVQAVLQDRMDRDAQHLWAERAVRAVYDAFPEIEVATWSRCQRLILHAQMCAKLIDQWHMVFPDAAYLLNQAGYYLGERARYKEAEALHEQAQAIWEQVAGPEDLYTAMSLNHLGVLYTRQGKYEQAEPLLQRALAIRRQVLGAEHPDTATILGNLATIYDAHGQYEQAESLLQQALEIRRQVRGLEHLETANGINNLAFLYARQGKYEQAQPLYQEALAICKKVLGEQHPDMAICLNNLAAIYEKQDKYEQAESLFQEALSICERVFGPEHPDTARQLSNLAGIYGRQGEYGQAESLYRRALAIYEQLFGSEHVSVLTLLSNLAGLYYAQRQYEQAEQPMRRTLASIERVLGPDHPDIATYISNLALLYYAQEEYEQAEPLLQRALAIREQALGPDHPDTTVSFTNMVELYQVQGRYKQVISQYHHALTTRERSLGPEHPQVATLRNEYAYINKQQAYHSAT